MKVLLINGSPHAHGCTYTALSVVADELEKGGVETEIIHVGHKNIRGCIGCFKCCELGRCVFDKDMVNEVAKKFEEADGMVIGSPVYYAGANGSLVSFLNRLFFTASFEKRFKVGAAVVSARRMGTTATLDQLNKYFLHGEMPVVASCYWNAVHGRSATIGDACQSKNSPEDVMKDEEGLQTMRVLGRNMAFLIRAIHAEHERSGLPEQEPQRIATDFIR